MKKVNVNRNKVYVNRIEVQLKIPVTKRIVLTIQNMCSTLIGHLNIYQRTLPILLLQDVKYWGITFIGCHKQWCINNVQTMVEGVRDKG